MWRQFGSLIQVRLVVGYEVYVYSVLELDLGQVFMIREWV